MNTQKRISFLAGFLVLSLGVLGFSHAKYDTLYFLKAQTATYSNSSGCPADSSTRCGEGEANTSTWCASVSTNCSPTQNADGTWLTCPWSQQCYYPDNDITCVVSSGSTMPACPSGTTLCSPGNSACLEPSKTYTARELQDKGTTADSAWCTSSTTCYGSDGSVSCVSQSSTSSSMTCPSPYSVCRPNETSCLDPGRTYTVQDLTTKGTTMDSIWCRSGMTCYANDGQSVKCQEYNYSTSGSNSTSCPSGFSTNRSSTTTTTTTYGDCRNNATSATCAAQPGCAWFSTYCEGDNHVPTTTTTTTSSCGNQVCESGETTATCPADCGTTGTTTDTTGTCGDGTCSVSETSSTCPADCGDTGTTPPVISCNYNGTCDDGETATSCASDCGGTLVKCEEDKRYGPVTYTDSTSDSYYMPYVQLCQQWVECPMGGGGCPWFQEYYYDLGNSSYEVVYVKRNSFDMTTPKKPEGAQVCRPGDTRCLEPGREHVLTDYQWENWAYCNSGETCYNKENQRQVFCQEWNNSGTPMTTASAKCPTGYTKCDPRNSSNSVCIEAGESVEKSKVSSGQWVDCRGGRSCDMGDKYYCSEDWNSCPEGAKYCANTGTASTCAECGKCVEPGEKGGKRDYCGAGAQCYTKSGELFCQKFDTKASTTTTGTTGYAAPYMMMQYECPSDAPLYCNPENGGYCLEPGQTGKSGSYCGNYWGQEAQVYNTDGTVTCKKKPAKVVSKCGDSVCSADETEASCAVDCKAKEELKCGKGYESKFMQQVGRNVCVSTGESVCLQVLTKAVDPKTKTCFEFPSSCVPEGWGKPTSATATCVPIVRDVVQTDICVEVKTFVDQRDARLARMDETIDKFVEKGQRDYAAAHEERRERMSMLFDQAAKLAESCAASSTDAEKNAVKAAFATVKSGKDALEAEIKAFHDSIGRDQSDEYLEERLEKRIELTENGIAFLEDFAELDPRIEGLIENQKEHLATLKLAEEALEGGDAKLAAQLLNDVQKAQERFERFLEKYGFTGNGHVDDFLADLEKRLSEQMQKRIEESLPRMQAQLEERLNDVWAAFLEQGKEEIFAIISEKMNEMADELSSQVAQSMKNLTVMNQELKDMVTETKAQLTEVAQSLDETKLKLEELALENTGLRTQLHDILEAADQKLLTYNLTTATAAAIRSQFEGFAYAVAQGEMTAEEALVNLQTLLADMDRKAQSDWQYQQEIGLIRFHDSASHLWHFGAFEELDTLFCGNTNADGTYNGTVSPGREFNWAELISVLNRAFGVAGSANPQYGTPVPWAAPAISAAVEEGLVPATAVDSSSELGTSVSRGEMFALAYDYVSKYQPEFLPAAGTIDDAVIDEKLGALDADFLADHEGGLKDALAFFVDEEVVRGQGGGDYAGQLALHMDINRAEAGQVFKELVRIGLEIAADASCAN